MSLDQLRRLRRNGKRPECVTVFLGTPGVIEDGPSLVVVDRDDLDLRPLVGLPLHLIDLRAEPDFTLRVIADLQELGTTLLGAATSNGVVGVSAEHEQAMRRFRRTLCES